MFIVEKYYSLMNRFRAFWIKIVFKLRFSSVGRFAKIRGKGIKVGDNVRIGDFCWIECVNYYKDQVFKPAIIILDDVAMSDFVHISSIKSIAIGKGTLIGSRVYIGDHSHGHYRDFETCKSEKTIMPKDRPLADEEEIKIGENCWIGDGVVILAGSVVGDNCVIAANSVVKGKFPESCLLAGLPAKNVKEL